MPDEEMHMLNAQNQMDRYLSHIEEALSSEEEDEVRRHIQEGMLAGQDAMDSLEEAISFAEDPDVADRLENAMHHLGMSLDQAEQAFESSEEDVNEYLSEMLRHAEQSMSLVVESV